MHHERVANRTTGATRERHGTSRGERHGGATPAKLTDILPAC
jgi:hypothetical protein